MYIETDIWCRQRELKQDRVIIDRDTDIQRGTNSRRKINRGKKGRERHTERVRL